MSSARTGRAGLVSHASQRPNLNPGSIFGRSATFARGQPVSYIHHVMRVSLGWSMRAGFSLAM